MKKNNFSDKKKEDMIGLPVFFRTGYLLWYLIAFGVAIVQHASAINRTKVKGFI
jgi:hypothetical protein